MHRRDIAGIEPPGLVGKVGRFRIAAQLPQERPRIEAIVHQNGNPLGSAVGAAIIAGIIIRFVGRVVLSFRGDVDIIFILLYGGLVRRYGGLVRREKDVHKFVVVRKAGGVCGLGSLRGLLLRPAKARGHEQGQHTGRQPAKTNHIFLLEFRTGSINRAREIANRKGDVCAKCPWSVVIRPL
jgi:hypothetical protein